MDLGSTGRVAIVTGPARGLGATRARRLAQEGAKVVITDINAELALALLRDETIKERAVQAQPIKHFGKPNDIADAVAFLASERAGFVGGEVLHVTVAATAEPHHRTERTRT